MTVMCAFVVCGCAPLPKKIPANVYVGDRTPSSWPTPQIRNPSQKAVIQAMRFSTLDLHIGNDWSGDFLASTNTASIEVIGTNIFSFSVPGPPNTGHFHFYFHTTDVPPFFIRPYSLRVIARNGGGDETEVDLPFRISGR